MVNDEVVMPTGGNGKPLLLALLTLSSAALDSEILQGDLHKHPCNDVETILSRKSTA